MSERYELRCRECGKAWGNAPRSFCDDCFSSLEVSFDYEATTSRLRQIRDEQNQLTQFSYNPDDSLKEQRYMNAVMPTPSIKFTYDADYLRVATMADGNGPIPTPIIP